MHSRRRGRAKLFLAAGTGLVLGAALTLDAQLCFAADAASDSAANSTAEGPQQANDVWTPDDAGALIRRSDGADAKAAVAPPAVKYDNKTFSEAVKELEVRVFGHSNPTTSAEATLARMESFVICKPQSGPLQKRLEHVQAILDGQQAEEPEAGDKAHDGAQASGGAAGAGAAAPSNAAKNDPASVSNSASTSTPAAAQPVSPAQVLRGRVDKLASNYALAGITLRANTLPSEIMVRPGSLALRAGVMDHDKLLHAELGLDTLQLVLQRDGQKLVVEVPLAENSIATKVRGGDMRLNSGAASTGTAPPGAFALKGSALDDWKILKRYNIAALLDVSGSMGAMQPEVGMTKHDWCLQQITSFAAEAERLGSGAFDLGTFSSDYSLTPNCTSAQAVAQLSANPPHGGTDIATPLQAAINTRYTKSAGKPFLIVVITDGIPGTGEPLDSLIVRASRQARSAGDIKIIFLQIGSGRGSVLAEYLDTQLVSEGAPYDIVSSIEWDQLSRIGLRSGLIAAMRKPAGQEVVLDPQKIMQFEQMRAYLALSKQRFDYRQNMPQQMQQQMPMMRNMRTNSFTSPYRYP